jgi:hypothetical protein
VVLVTVAPVDADRISATLKEAVSRSIRDTSATRSRAWRRRRVFSALPCGELGKDERMAVVARLRTFVDISDEDDDGPDARRMSVTARHEAVLTDGRRVLLLDDRGWSEQLGAWGVEPSEQERELVQLPGVWVTETVEDMERTARDVVGPDEPFEGHTKADMEADHWDSLARVLQQEGVEVEAAQLRGLPHDVELSDRVLARIGRGRADTG